MKITVKLDSEGFLPDKYGKNAPAEYLKNDGPILSFPIEIDDLPQNTQALALTLIDYDAVPVAGFPWIHWIATDIPVTNIIPEDASRINKNITQGKNSMVSRYINVTDPTLNTRYAGPKPPENHDYTLTVFALSQPTHLSEGFYLNELLKSVKPITLDTFTLNIKSRK
ncbi:YbhB/YbcL family Raf kinase inhibitor-like protein [Pediococcus argentinicus]|uniref:YbhB/YbcL family Raf kinase inhibitor-like protein n=1 Tax=Pediococcus argentinicus TaxID=480391 RepID=UPI00338FC359